MVETGGFPLPFSVFAGNKFEGKTLIPVILNFKRKHRVDNLTVVADAAMISQNNILALSKAGLNYIVGARLGNAGLAVIQDVSRRLNRAGRRSSENTAWRRFPNLPIFPNPLSQRQI